MIMPPNIDPQYFCVPLAPDEMPILSEEKGKLVAPILPRAGSLSEEIAHDCNSILTRIFTHVQVALKGISDGDPARNHLRHALTGCLRIQELVTQIVACGQAAAQERKPVQLRGIVEEVLALLRVSLPPTVNIYTNLACTPSTILANQTQIYQVLLNLCANAGQAMTETGGILEIDIQEVMVTESLARQHSVLKRSPHVRLTVRDTGSGMTPEVQARIFEPFFTTKPVGEGTGIGLTLVHTIITNHGGAIGVNSAVGNGTTFTVYLPSMPEGRRNSERSAGSIAGEKNAILLVADHDPVYVE